MARLIGPDDRTWYVSNGTARAQGMTARLWADAGQAAPADVLTLPGVALPVVDGAAVTTIDAYSQLPLLQFPDGVDTIYGSVNGGPVVPLYARYDDRIDAQAARLTEIEADIVGLPAAIASATSAANAATAAGIAATAAIAAAVQSPGKNLFDATAAYGPDLFWNGVGSTPIALAGWYASRLIPVTPAATYSINNCRNYCFMDGAGLPIAGTYFNNVTSAPVTFAASPTAVSLVFNVSAANLFTCQAEAGPACTSYEPYGIVIDRLLSGGQYVETTLAEIPALDRSAGIAVHRDGNGMLIRSAFDATRDLLMPMSLNYGNESQTIFATDANPFVAIVPKATQDDRVWPTIATGTAIHGASDDNCPINVQWSYIGGNHGYSGSQVTLTAHGKTTADVGSQWTDGIRTFTLLTITDANTLLFGGQYSVVSGVVTGSTSLPAATLTHVSGATNTSSIATTSVVSVQIHPSSYGQSVSVLLDGRNVPDGKAYGQMLTITETYVVASYKDMIDVARANIGVPVGSVISTVAGLVRISNTYRITARQMVIGQRVTAVEKCTLNIGVTQAFPLTVYPTQVKKQFMAGIGTAGGVNFSTMADLAGVVSDTDITSAAYLNPTAPAQRMTQWVYDAGAVAQYGLSIGLLPTGDSHPVQRLKNAATKSWFITGSIKKNYPQIAWAKTLNIGESLAGTAFRQYLAPPDTTTELVVSDGADTWVMLDRVATTTGARMPVPTLLGKRLQPIGPVTTVIADRVTGDGITYSVPTSPGYGLWLATGEPRLETIPGATLPVGSYFIAQQGLVSTQALTGSYQILYLFPLYLPEATPVDRACLEVTTLGTGVIRHGAYANDPLTGMPVLTGPTADFGTVDVTSAGVKESTLAPAAVLPAGVHWYGYAWQTLITTPPSIRVLSNVTGLGPLNIGSSSAGMSGARQGYFMTGVTGALGALTIAGTHQLTAPRVAYRRA